MRIAIRFFLLLAAIILIALVVSFAYIDEKMRSAGPLRENIEILVPKGASLRSIATLLEEKNVIADANIFILWARYSEKHNRLKAGEYSFDPGIRPIAVIEKLESHAIIDRFITIPEGLGSREIVALLNRAEFLVGQINIIPPEGSLLPETYHYAYGDSRLSLIEKMKQAQSSLLRDLWAQRAAGLPFSTPQEALVLASIVEKETGVTGERAKIAGVFVNRLRKGMRLQSDPTVAFAIEKGEGRLARPLTRKDLKYRHPYNTYIVKALPPGPITNPGRAAIESVLNPEQTKALYFVADGSGGHAFANNLADHNRNVANWRKFQRKNK